MEQVQGQEARSYWRSQIECVTAPSQWALAKKINDLYARGLFVVGTQTFAPRHSDNKAVLLAFDSIEPISVDDIAERPRLPI